MAKELTPVKVETRPNGYSLTVYHQSYLYYSEAELFEGLCYHAGMAILKEQDKKVIREVIANLLAGETKDLMERCQEQQIENAKLSAKISKLKAEKTKLETKLKRYEKKKDAYDYSLNDSRADC